MATADLLNDPELLATEWDLSPLVDGDEQDGVQSQLQDALTRATAFAAAYDGKLGELDGAGLATAMHELAAISELVGKAGSFASLRFATDSDDPARGALLQLVQERATELETTLLFFELQWAALPDERAEALLADPGLAFCAHYLRSARRYRPHLLSEPEERIFAEKSLSSSGSWARLFGEQMAAMRVTLDGEPVVLDLALSRLMGRDRDTRRQTAEAISEALEPGLRTRAFIFNTLVYDKSVDDRLRAYPHWLAARNLANEASDESVIALIEAVRGRFDIPQRWYRLKAKLLGLDVLEDYDRYAPLETAEISYSFGEAREFVLGTYESLSPDAGAVVRRFFDERWIDAPTRPAQARRRLLLLHRAQRSPVRDAQLHGQPPRCAGDGPRARPRPARRAGPAPGRLPPGHAADHGRDGIGVRRGADLRPPARAGARRRGPAGPAGRADRRLDRDRVPPDGDEPLRAPRPHRAPLGGRAVGGPDRRDVDREPDPSCSATPCGCSTDTGCGGPTCRTSSTRPDMSMPTPMGSCWPCRSTAAT